MSLILESKQLLFIYDVCIHENSSADEDLELLYLSIIQQMDDIPESDMIRYIFMSGKCSKVDDLIYKFRDIDNLYIIPFDESYNNLEYRIQIYLLISIINRIYCPIFIINSQLNSTELNSEDKLQDKFPKLSIWFNEVRSISCNGFSSFNIDKDKLLYDGDECNPIGIIFRRCYRIVERTLSLEFQFYNGTQIKQRNSMIMHKIDQHFISFPFDYFLDEFIGIKSEIVSNNIPVSIFIQNRINLLEIYKNIFSKTHKRHRLRKYMLFLWATAYIIRFATILKQDKNYSSSLHLMLKALELYIQAVLIYNNHILISESGNLVMDGQRIFGFKSIWDKFRLNFPSIIDSTLESQVENFIYMRNYAVFGHGILLVEQNDVNEISNNIYSLIKRINNALFTDKQFDSLISLFVKESRIDTVNNAILMTFDSIKVRSNKNLSYYLKTKANTSIGSI